MSNVTTDGSEAIGNENQKSFKDIFFLIGDRTNLVYALVGAFLELLLFILFCFLIINKKSWDLKGFAILLSIGYFIDLFAQFCWIIASIEKSVFWINATQASYIYAVASSGIWNTFLSMNRCTAVLWPMKHSRVWSTKNICIYCFLILLYPLAIQGHIVFDDRFYDEGIGLETSKTNFLLVNRLILGVSNTFMALIMLSGTLVVYIKNHKTNASNSQKWEVKMLLHCAFSSFFMIAFSQFFLFAAILNPIQQMVAIGCEFLSLFMYSTFHNGSILMLLIVNKTIRKLFFNFYTFGKYKKIQPSKTIVNPSSNFHSNRKPTAITPNPVVNR